MATYIKKGGAGTLGFNDMTAVTQILETLLEKLRKQELTLTDEMSSALLEAGEVISRQSAIHRDGGKVDAHAVGAICAKLERFLITNPDGSDNSTAATKTKPEATEQKEDSDYGFFGQQPQVKPDTETEEEQEDYGFFKEK